MTYDEAGKVLECSAGTVKSRVSRAREAVIARFNSREATQHGSVLVQGMDKMLKRIWTLTGEDRLVA